MGDANVDRISDSPLVQDLLKVAPVQVQVLQHGIDVGGVVGLGVAQQSLSKLMDPLVLLFVILVSTRDLLQERLKRTHH